MSKGRHSSTRFLVSNELGFLFLLRMNLRYFLENENVFKNHITKWKTLKIVISGYFHLTGRCEF